MVKILIIDDDKDTCKYLQEFFEQRKCVVLTAYSGKEGLAIVKREDPGIVLLDIRMEGIDGLEVLKEIKRQDGTIKVIMITAASDEETREKAQQLGADYFIKKPLNTIYLEGTVSVKIAEFTRERKKKLFKAPKILIVDDEQQTRQSLREYLSPRIECEIFEVSDGYEAVKKLENDKIDLILLDINMPGMKGTQVIKKAREISKDIAIIVITKWDTDEISKQLKNSEVEYIPKPLSLKVVRQKVEEKLKDLGKYSEKLD